MKNKEASNAMMRTLDKCGDFALATKRKPISDETFESIRQIAEKDGWNVEGVNFAVDAWKNGIAFANKKQPLLFTI